MLAELINTSIFSPLYHGAQYMNVQGFLPWPVRPCNHMNLLQGSVKQSFRKHPITTSLGHIYLHTVLPGKHYKKSTMQTNTWSNRCHQWWSCFHLFSDILVPDGIEEGILQHIVWDINCFERPSTENCDVHPTKTTLDITFHFLSNWDSVLPVHEWGMGFNIFTCEIKTQQLVEKSHH